MKIPKRGEIWLVSFDPTLGSEIKKTRPALIIQNDIGNRLSRVTIVAAISSQFQEPVRPIEVLIRAPEGGLTSNSVVLANQIRSVDKQRLIRRLGRLKEPTLGRVAQVLMISLGLVAI